MADIVTAQGIIIAINDDDNYDPLFVILSVIFIFCVPSFSKSLGIPGVPDWLSW